MCHLPHLPDDSDRLQEQAAPLIRKPLPAARQGKALAGGAKGHNVHRRQGPAIQLLNIPQLFHLREMPPGDAHRIVQDLTGPQRPDAVKGGGIGKATYAVKQRA